MEYVLCQRPLILADGPSRAARRFDPERYFKKSYRIFQSRLEKFRESTAAPTAEEERELKFMMEALIDAKRLLRED
jgi:hypothetical protein